MSDVKPELTPEEWAAALDCPRFIRGWMQRRRKRRVQRKLREILQPMLDDMEAMEREYPNFFTGEGPHHVPQQTTERRRLIQ